MNPTSGVGGGARGVEEGETDGEMEGVGVGGAGTGTAGGGVKLGPCQ